MIVFMNMDPRILKEWIRLQILPPFSGTASAVTGKTDSGPSFSDLLHQLLAAGSSKDRAAADPSSNGPSALPASVETPLASMPGNIPETSGYDAMIEAAARRHQVDESLIKAVIHTESSFRADAVSRAGAKGLMQLMDGTARELGVTDSFDPVQNIEGGTLYLSRLIRKYDGQTAVALAAYNAGPGTVDRLGVKTNEQLAMNLDRLPAETRQYVAKVLERQAVYAAEANRA
jgi:soluble lytic murein transglycosylase-like protein